MKNPRLLSSLIVLAAALFLGGCVTGRRTVALTIPTIGGNLPSKGEVYIGTIKDNRWFENKPASPSTPSIDGDVSGLSAEQKTVFIGRQRNTYGHAMGDVALPANDSVIQRTRRLFEEGLKSRGYQIAKDNIGPNSAEIVIEKFWAWFTPRMWTVTFEANVDCTITLKRSDQITKLVVRGYGKNSGQVAKDENWQLAYTRAFTDFLLNLDKELAKAGL